MSALLPGARLTADLRSPCSTASKRRPPFRAARCALLALFCACVHGAPPAQLETARQDYRSAQVVGSSRDVEAAGAALAAANREFEEHGDSIRARDLAYVASRRADIAKANARAMAERRRVAEIALETTMLQQQERAMAQGEVAPPPPPPPPPVATAASQVEVATAPSPVDGTQVVPAPNGPLTPALSPTRGEGAQGRAPQPMRPSVSFRPPRLSFASVKGDDTGATVISVPAALLYEPASEALSDTAKPRLDQIAGAIKDRQVTVEVHGDDQGGSAELCDKRANSVRDALVARGVAADQIKAAGRGDSSPLVDNSTAENRAKNRRVDIIVR